MGRSGRSTGRALGGHGVPGRRPSPRRCRVTCIPLAARGFVRASVLLAAGCVWLATSLSMGVSVWTMLGTVWQTRRPLATPAASAFWGLVVVGALALYWLQRLLGSEGE